MAQRPTPSEEEQRLRQATREAHEAMQGLADLLRQARELAVSPVSDFEAIHHREIKQLSNHMTEEVNRAASSLNADVAHARELIRDQLLSGEAVFDWTTSTVKITFGPGKFDANTPPPYPQVTTRKDTQ